MFVHSVFFYKNPAATPPQIEQFIHDCYSLLSKIPGVTHLQAGPPAMTPRPVVDNTYAVGLTVILTDSAAHDLYQSHPLHLDFIARNKSTWARVQIYDFLSQTQP
jgi:hypothetical protein